MYFFTVKSFGADKVASAPDNKIFSEVHKMKGLLRFIFGTIWAVVITAIIFAVTLFIGRAVTGSWDIREWTGSEPAAVVTEYIPE